MNDAVITLKTNSELKRNAMKIADDLGFSLSSLINAYLKNFVKTKTVSYTLQPEGEPTEFMIKGLKESAKDIKTGRVVSFNSLKEELDYLDKLIDDNESKLLKKVRKTTKKSSTKYQKTIPAKTSYLPGQSI